MRRKPKIIYKKEIDNMKKMIGIFVFEAGYANIKIVKAWGETPLRVVEREFPRRTSDVSCIDIREYNPETEMYNIETKEGYTVLKTIRAIYGSELVIE